MLPVKAVTPITIPLNAGADAQMDAVSQAVLQNNAAGGWPRLGVYAGELYAFDTKRTFSYEHGMPVIGEVEGFTRIPMDKVGLTQILQEWCFQQVPGTQRNPNPPAKPVHREIVDAWFRLRKWTKIVPTIRGIYPAPFITASDDPQKVLRTESDFVPDEMLFISGTVPVPSVISDGWYKDADKVRNAVFTNIIPVFNHFYLQDNSLEDLLGVMLTPYFLEMTKYTYENPSDYSNNVPAVCIYAPGQETGKSVLARQLVKMSGVATHNYSERAYDPRPDKVRRHLTESLKPLNGLVGYLIQDNADVQIGGASVEQLFTSRVYTTEKMYSDDGQILPNNALWIWTANRPNVTPDMRRRMLVIRLSKVKFKTTEAIHESAAAFEDYLDSLDINKINETILAVYLHWRFKGSPMGSKTLPSFVNWAGSISGMLEGIGFDGFLDEQDIRRSALETGAADTADMLDLLRDFMSDMKDWTANDFHVRISAQGGTLGSDKGRILNDWLKTSTRGGYASTTGEVMGASSALKTLTGHFTNDGWRFDAIEGSKPLRFSFLDPRNNKEIKVVESKALDLDEIYGEGYTDAQIRKAEAEMYWGASPNT